MTNSPTSVLALAAILRDIAADEAIARAIKRIASRRRGQAMVYRYQFWDEATSLFVTAKREATLDCIRCGLGIPVLSSGRPVAFSDLDSVGRVNPIVAL
jgi:hypothetical protein